jgi:hypothetical protein
MHLLALSGSESLWRKLIFLHACARNVFPEGKILANPQGGVASRGVINGPKDETKTNLVLKRRTRIVVVVTCPI